MDASIRQDGLDLQIDAGLNSSAAWTEHFDARSVDSDNPVKGDEEWSPAAGIPARVLKNFQGDPAASELSVIAGYQLHILMEEVMQGWSLAKIDGIQGEQSRMGLIPSSHYAFTSELERSPQVIANTPPLAPIPLAALGSASSDSNPLAPISPQLTGAPSKKLLAKSINRFSSFVTSGAEEWINYGSSRDLAPSTIARRNASDDSQVAGDPYLHDRPEPFFTETPPAWRVTTPSYRVMVHSPSKRSSTLGSAYTVYSVTSMFPNSSVPHVTVFRRFSQFSFLHTALSRRLPGVALPPLPEKQYTGRFNQDFVEARRGDLERWINRIVRHPLARATEVVMFFLGCEDDSEWAQRLPIFLAAYPTPGPSFYSHVFHPQFNIDAEDTDTELTGHRFRQYVDRLDGKITHLRHTFTQVREAGTETATASRAFSYSFLGLIAAAHASDEGDSGVPGAGGVLPTTESESRGLSWTPRNGAWCWRDDCDECLCISKAFQKMAETFQSIADLHDDHAQRYQLTIHETLKDVAYPSRLYAPIIDIHRSALSSYSDANASANSIKSTADDVAGRAETVLNATMAEFDTYHSQKNEDLLGVAGDHLDGEIALHEQILVRLRAARKALDISESSSASPGPRKPSIYERDLSNGVAESRSARSGRAPLILPAAHVFDSTSSRLAVNIEPVAQAMKEGVGSLFRFGGQSPSRAWASPGVPVSELRGNAPMSRSGSVLSRFW